MDDTELKKALGARIRLLREERKILQQDLASMCNFEKGNMSKLEAGRSNPKFLTLYKISNALNIPLSQLVDLDGK